MGEGAGVQFAVEGARQDPAPSNCHFTHTPPPTTLLLAQTHSCILPPTTTLPTNSLSHLCSPTTLFLQDSSCDPRIQALWDPVADWTENLSNTQLVLASYRAGACPRLEATASDADRVAIWLQATMSIFCRMPAPSKPTLLPVAEAALGDMHTVSDKDLKPYWTQLETYWAQTEAELHGCKRLLRVHAWDPVEDVVRKYRTWNEHWKELSAKCNYVMQQQLEQVMCATAAGSSFRNHINLVLLRTA